MKLNLARFGLSCGPEMQALNLRSSAAILLLHLM